MEGGVVRSGIREITAPDVLQAIRDLDRYSEATHYSLESIAETFGAAKFRGRYSRRAYRIYERVSRLLQVIRRDGLVECRRGIGWRLSSHRLENAR